MYYFSVIRNEFFLCCMTNFGKLKMVYLFHVVQWKKVCSSYFQQQDIKVKPTVLNYQLYQDLNENTFVLIHSCPV